MKWTGNEVTPHAAVEPGRMNVVPYRYLLGEDTAGGR